MSPLLLRRALQVTAGTLAGLAVVAVYVLGFPAAQPEAAGPPVDLAVPEPYPAPSFSLLTAEGRAFTEAELRGEVSVVFFGFASCPDVCPITLSALSRALELLEARDLDFQGVFVSVDPGRDTPEVLREYMGRFHPSITALTGAPEAIERLTGAWGIHVSFVEGDEVAEAAGASEGHERPEASEGHGGHGHAETAALPGGAAGYQVTHSTRAWVVDREGRIVRTLPAYLAAEEIVAALEPYLE